MTGYPGALALLAANLPRELDNHSSQLVVCMGEVLDEARRATIEQGFGRPTMDVYSGSEFGIVATEDRAAARLFITEETMLVEFRPRADIAGNRERLVEIIVTPFYNYAMPLIRYSTGDLAVVDEDPAPDGRVLRRLVRTVGRQRDLPAKRAALVTANLRRQARRQIFECRTDSVRTDRTRADRFVSRAAEPLRNVPELSAKLHASVPEPVEFAIRQVPAIARHASGKFIDYVCEIEAWA